MLQTSVTSSAAVSVETLQGMSTTAMLQLFRQLPAPTIAEMQGEYKASMLQQPNVLATLAGHVLESPFLPWQCKAFRSVDEQHGRGYNTFLLGAKTIQLYPMQTMLAPSRYDGRPAYHLIYRHFHSLCASMHMVDELRRIVPGIYLGIGTWGFSKKQRAIPYPFLLQGPVADYRNDIGISRRGFEVGVREIPEGL